MGCVKKGGSYLCVDHVGCPFDGHGWQCSSRFWDRTTNDAICCNKPARTWADDKAKIEEQAKRIQDLGDELDNVNELLTIAEEKRRELWARVLTDCGNRTQN